MKFKAKKYFLLLLVLLVISCSVPDRVINLYTQCYDGKKSEINKLCKIQGYYIGKFNTKIDDSGGWNVIFFEDGTCAINIKKPGDRDIFKGKDLYLKSAVPSWGTYIINDKIILSQIINYSSKHLSEVYEYKYKVLNDSTIYLVSSRRLRDDRIWLNDSTSNDHILPMKFIKIDDKPEPNCWMKGKAWFWCNQDKYLKYREEMSFKKQ